VVYYHARLHDGQEIGELVLNAEVKLGEELEKKELKPKVTPRTEANN
jgi:hypothetical protein